jgi:hypothetical protein
MAIKMHDSPTKRKNMGHIKKDCKKYPGMELDIWLGGGQTKKKLKYVVKV